ncbi:MAG: ribose-phosphate pyrophosphokinase [Burkholderiaceae bacterium]|nr:ribose-phosphate pyrophosphokinase [Burkholderiaceae bacterium]
MNPDTTCIFALNASRDFGLEVCRHLGITMCAHEEREFEDREHKARPLVNVHNKHVFVIQSLHADDAQSANDKLVRLLFFIGTLKDAAAARVTVLVPYLCYARKDRKTQADDPVTTQYVARLFEAAGADCVVTLDVHNLAAFQNAFRCRTEHLEANQLFVRHFAPMLTSDEVIVISPDAGGIKRAERFRQVLRSELQRQVHAGFAEKYRAQGVVSGELVVGDIDGKIALIIDDLISTGGTIARVANVCRERGARQVFAVATHGLFVEPASAVLAGDALDGIVVTNSVPPFRIRDDLARSKLQVLDCAPLFAETVRMMCASGT